MEIYNPEQDSNGKKVKMVMVMFESKEVEELMNALGVATRERPRKSTWSKMLNELENKACCF